MIDISNPTIDFKAQGAEEIYQNVRTIITTPAGSVPFDRDFGISQAFLDAPMSRAEGMVTIEYIERIKKYEPRAQVREVTFSHDPLDGRLKPRVVIGLVND